MQHERFHYKSVDEIKSALSALSLPPLPFSEDLSSLSSPAGRFRNRFALQPMEGCDGSLDGRLGELSIRRYKRYAEGGAALIWFEAVAITPEARANPRQPWLNRENLSDFSRIVSEIKDAGFKANGFSPVIILQATHSGRYSKPEGISAPIIAYNNPIFEKDHPIPSDCIISDDGLRHLEDCYAATACLAEKAGFDGIDIKCCHRYLNSELLSAFTRKGEYGGSLENRTRLLRNGILSASSATSSSFIKTTRINIYDGFPYPYGFGTHPEAGNCEFDPSEPSEIFKMLSSLGVSLINISMGNPYVNPHVNRPYDLGGYVPPEHPLEGLSRLVSGTAEMQRRFPGISVVASGLSYLREFSFPLAAGMISSGMTSMVGFGRESFAYPGFPNDVMNGLLDRRKLCVCCSKCTELMRAGSATGCVVRDPDIYLPMYRQFCRK